MKWTLCLLAVNLLVFALYAAPHGDDIGALIDLALGNELAGITVSINDIWPGLAAYMFGHAGVAHLGMNMAMLLMVGRGLEERAGARIIPIYLVSGVIGAFAHMTFSGLLGGEFGMPLIGASAAVSGVFGAAVAYRTVGARDIIYFVFVLNVAPMFFLPDSGVSHESHLGGVVAGLTLGGIFVLAGCIGRRLRRGPADSEQYGAVRDYGERPAKPQYGRGDPGVREFIEA